MALVRVSALAALLLLAVDFFMAFDAGREVGLPVAFGGSVALVVSAMFTAAVMTNDDTIRIAPILFGALFLTCGMAIKWVGVEFAAMPPIEGPIRLEWWRLCYSALDMALGFTTWVTYRGFRAYDAFHDDETDAPSSERPRPRA